MRRALAALALLAALACGGRGDSKVISAPAVAWDRAVYQTQPGTQVQAIVTVSPGSEGLPNVVGVNVTPSGQTGAPVTAGNGPWQNSTGRIPVMFTVAPTAPRGSYPITATFSTGIVSTTAQATIEVI